MSLHTDVDSDFGSIPVITNVLETEIVLAIPPATGGSGNFVSVPIPVLHVVVLVPGLSP
jgi:hypothetical protein